jgi:N-acetyl-anhydromuramyl-L-alanine amidase AmpD
VQPFVKDPSDLFLPPKADRPWRYIVLHHSAHSSGNYAQIDREHRQALGTAGCGYHFVIGNGSGSPDGQIEIAERWSDQKGGAHCRNGKNPDVNEYGIGICLIGNFDDAPPTARQIEASRALVSYLSDRYHISSDRIGPHSLLANGPTACPGKNFPATAILGDRGFASRTAE